MKYHTLSPSELETYNIGYMVGNRKMVITDVEWESEQEHRIYRKGYMAGLMDYKRNVSNVSNVHSQDKVSNVDFQTPITSTTPIGNSISNSNKEIDNDKEEDLITKLEKEELAKTKTKRFTPPTLEEVKAYCLERRNGIDPQRFISSYQSKGWMVGKSPMKDWKAAVRTWERSGFNTPQKAKSISSPDYVGEGSFLRRAEDDPFCADL